MTDLATKKCQDSEEIKNQLDSEEIKTFIDQCPGWTLAGNKIHRSIKFVNHHKLMTFLNALAWISDQENHHPNVCYSYDQCELIYFTHSIENLSKNDFICAAKVNKLLL